jgi:hypothetical protein
VYRGHDEVLAFSGCLVIERLLIGFRDDCLATAGGRASVCIHCVIHDGVFLHEWIPEFIVTLNPMVDEGGTRRTHHSRYFGKSRSTFHTLSLGASIMIDAET